MIRLRLLALAGVASLATLAAPRLAAAQTSAARPAPATATAREKKPAAAARPAGLAPVRFRLVLNGVYSVSGPSYSDTRELSEYAETTTLRTSYEAKGAFGPDAALQVSLFRGLGVLVGFSSLSRDVSGTVDVSRPHPLYLDRARSASSALSGYAAKETALHLDLAYAGSRSRVDWTIFAGATMFSVDADLLGTPTYTEAYPYDELKIASTPSASVSESKTGFNVGARVDYRFGAAGRFGAGVQVRYSAASIALEAASATSAASYDAGGLEVGAGLRLFF
ncbi:MAG: hypothetical protein U0599_18265 [Vicinamibacteria bacterium]